MNKSVTGLALSLILTSLLIPLLSFAPIPPVKATEQLFFEDNFENYTVGDFPSSGGWELWYNGLGTEEQTIVDNVACSPTKSLKLLGLDFWAGFAAKRFTSTSSVIGFEVAVRVEETNGEGRDNARVAFTTKLNSLVSCEYAPVTFQDSGVIASGGQVLQSYVADTWYKIKLLMDRADDTYSVWVDGELKGENLTVTTTSGPIAEYPSSEIEAFSVSQCYNSVTAYFDDVKVFSSYESDPALELAPNTGITTTTLVGSGFAPDSQISVTWDGIPIPTVPNQVFTNSSGGFTCIVSVLNQTGGAYTVRAVDETGNEASATFTVTLVSQSKTAIMVPDDYPTIQEAIDNAQEGDTITVKAGTYYEYVVVNKSVSLIGENKETTIIDGNSNGTVVRIKADNVSISGFTVQNCGDYPGMNIKAISNGNNITNNIIKNNGDGKGIALCSSSDNIVSDNDVSTTFYGIILDHSSYNVISNNLVSDNVYGIYVFDFSDNNLVSSNNISNCRGMGIDMGPVSASSQVVSDNVVVNNSISSSDIGIMVAGRSSNSTLVGNVIKQNSWGIYLQNTKNNTLFGNDIVDNSLGVYRDGSCSCTKVYHNNFINNSEQIDGAYSIDWDNGYPSGGNYWSDYNGTDDNGDGIGDTPYVISKNGQDNFPLMVPNNAEPSTSYRLTVDSVPSGVTFTADKTVHTTVWSETYNTNTPVSLTMPDYYSYNDKTYVWSRWSDGDTNRKRTVIMNEDTALTALFAPEDAALKISVLFPQNTTYNTPDIPLEYTVNRYFYSTTYSLDGQANETVVGNTTLTGLSTGAHSIVIYIEDSPRKISASETIYFTVAPALDVCILSPENRTYTTTDIPLTYTKNETSNSVTYRLDGQAAVDPESTTTLTGLTEGPHRLTFYVNYTDSHIGNYTTVWFTVDTTPPTITDIIQAPVDINGTAGNSMSVSATVTDIVSGIEQVTIRYTDGNGTWVNVEMTKLEGDIWNGTIPAFPHGTTITYTIIAEDKAGNTVTTEELYGEPNQYEVLPEFSLWIVVPLFLVATASAIVAKKRLSVPAFAKIYNSLHKRLT